MKKAISLILLSILALIILTGCYFDYAGDHADLYTVAINSILWTNGYTWGADHPMESVVEILEQDQYGRTLFTYYECRYQASTLAFSSLAVCQSSNEQFVFYYEDVNFIIKEQQRNQPKPVYEFTTEEIEQLKLANDWNKPLNLEKCIKKQITSQKPSIPHEKEVEKIILEEFRLEERVGGICINFLTYDSACNNYIIYGYVRDYPYPSLFFVGLVEVENNQIKDVHFLQPTDVFDYQTELMEFKNAHGWQ